VSEDSSPPLGQILCSFIAGASWTHFHGIAEGSTVIAWVRAPPLRRHRRRCKRKRRRAREPVSPDRCSRDGRRR
jgi:hypothetical protein